MCFRREYSALQRIDHTLSHPVINHRMIRFISLVFHLLEKLVRMILLWSRRCTLFVTPVRWRSTRVFIHAHSERNQQKIEILNINCVVNKSYTST